MFYEIESLDDNINKKKGIICYDRIQTTEG